MLVAVIVFTLGTGLQAGTQSPGMLFGGRVVGGIGIGMFSMVVSLALVSFFPMYTESFPRRSLSTKPRSHPQNFAAR